MKSRSIILILNALILLSSCSTHQSLKNQDFVIQLKNKDNKNTLEIVNDHGISLFFGKDSLTSNSIYRPKWIPTDIQDDTLYLDYKPDYTYTSCDSESYDSLRNKGWVLDYYNSSSNTIELKKEINYVNKQRKIHLGDIDSLRYQSKKKRYTGADFIGPTIILSAPFVSWEDGRFLPCRFFGYIAGGISYIYLVNILPYKIYNKDAVPKYYSMKDWDIRIIHAKHSNFNSESSFDKDVFKYNYSESNSYLDYSIGLKYSVLSGGLQKYFHNEVGVSGSVYYSNNNYLFGSHFDLYSAKVKNEFFLNEYWPKGFKVTVYDLNLMFGYRFQILKYFKSDILIGIHKSWLKRGQNKNEYPENEANSNTIVNYGISLGYDLTEDFISIYEKSNSGIKLSLFFIPVEFSREVKGGSISVRLEYNYSLKTIDIY